MGIDPQAVLRAAAKALNAAESVLLTLSIGKSIGSEEFHVRLMHINIRARPIAGPATV
jgi:hypothetical protein